MTTRQILVASIIFLVLLAVFAAFWGSRNRATTASNGLAQLVPGQGMGMQQAPGQFYTDPQMVPLVVVPPQYMTVPTPIIVDTGIPVQNTQNTQVSNTIVRRTVVTEPAPPANQYNTYSNTNYGTQYQQYPNFSNYPSGSNNQPSHLSSRNYIYKDAAYCATVVFTCTPHYRVFQDGAGCGCEPDPYNTYGY